MPKGPGEFEKHNLQWRKLFTLIELVLVVAILIVLAASMVPIMRSSRQEGDKARALKDLEALRTAFKQYNMDTGKYDVDIRNLLRNPPASPIPGWQGPYLNERLTDPWGNDYMGWGRGGGGMAPEVGFASRGPDGTTQFCGGDDICITVHRMKP